MKLEIFRGQFLSDVIRLKPFNEYNLHNIYVKKSLLVFSLLLIGVSAGLFRIQSWPSPRPFHVYLFSAVSLTLLFILGITNPRDKQLHGQILIVSILISFYLRISAYVGLSASGRDTQMWRRTAEGYMDAGFVYGGGMYAESPIYILELVVGRLITGLPDGSGIILGQGLYQAGGITVFVSLIVPIVIYAIGKQTANRTVGLIAALVSVAFPLLLRTSTIFESEHLAIVWLLLVTLLAVHYYQNRDQRSRFLLLAFTPLSMYLHFFYGTIIIMSVGLTGIILWISSKLFFDIELGSVYRTILIAIIGGCAISYHILWSSWDTHAATTIASALTFEIPANPLEIILPSGDSAAAASVGTSDSSSNNGLLGTVLNYYSLGFVLISTAIGGLAWLTDRDRLGMWIVSATIGIGGLTLGALIAGLKYNLHFRLFYIVGLFLIIISGVGMSYIISVTEDYNQIAPVLMIVLVLGFGMFAVTGPMSSLGNNVDSPYSDGFSKITHTEWEQLRALDDVLSPPGVEAPLSEDLPRIEPDSVPSTSNEDLELIDTHCHGRNSVWNSGTFKLCH